MEVLKKFIPISDERFSYLRRLLCCFYKLTDINDETDRALRNAIRKPDHYVLKTSKEAGEGNIFDEEEIAKVLSNYPSHPEKIKEYLLMKKIRLPSRFTYMVRNKQVDLDEANDEFSTFYYVACDIGQKKIYEPRRINHLVRTKSSSQDQGSFFAGACLSSIIVYENKDPDDLGAEFYKGLWQK